MAMKPNAFKPVRGKSVTIKLEPPKPSIKPGAARPVTPEKLRRAPEADDVLITTRKSPDIIRTSVRERMTPVRDRNSNRELRKK